MTALFVYLASYVAGLVDPAVLDAGAEMTRRGPRIVGGTGGFIGSCCCLFVLAVVVIVVVITRRRRSR